MTIQKIAGGNFGGIRSLFVDYVENVTDILVMSETAQEIPIREGSTSFNSGTQSSPAGPYYELKIQGFASGINKDNLAGFEALNNRKVIAWFEDYHEAQFALGILTQPARMVIETNIPADHKQAAGFNFTITSKQTVGLAVL